MVILKMLAIIYTNKKQKLNFPPTNSNTMSSFTKCTSARWRLLPVVAILLKFISGTTGSTGTTGTGIFHNYPQSFYSKPWHPLEEAMEHRWQTSATPDATETLTESWEATLVNGTSALFSALSVPFRTYYNNIAGGFSYIKSPRRNYNDYGAQEIAPTPPSYTSPSPAMGTVAVGAIKSGIRKLKNAWGEFVVL